MINLKYEAPFLGMKRVSWTEKEINGNFQRILSFKALHCNGQPWFLWASGRIPCQISVQAIKCDLFN